MLVILVFDGHGEGGQPAIRLGYHPLELAHLLDGRLQPVGHLRFHLGRRSPRVRCNHQGILDSEFRIFQPAETLVTDQTCAQHDDG